MPGARTVLLKEADERGLAFFTNLGSRKGRELGENPRAALVFPWHAMQRQVVVDGRVEAVDDEESDAYFASRPRGSRLGALASPQSQPIPGRDEAGAPLRRAGRRPPGRGAAAANGGAACAWCPTPWSSGRAVPTACTTGCASGAPSRMRASGWWSGWRPSGRR